MKKSLLILMCFVAAALTTEVSAQCTPPAATGEAGISDWTEIPCIEQGVPYSTTIEIENFSTVSGVSVTYLTVDSLSNLPNGITYAVVDQTGDGEFGPGETGCVAISGTTNDSVGCQQIGIYICVKVSLLPSELCDEASALIATIEGLLGTSTGFDFTYYTQIIPPGGVCDTNVCLGNTGPSCTDGIQNQDETGIDCGGTICPPCPTGIADVANELSGLLITPNPVTTRMEINLTSEVNDNYFVKILDLTGKEVYSETRAFTVGQNTFSIERGDLQKGVYLVAISNGKSNLTKRIMVSE